MNDLMGALERFNDAETPSSDTEAELTTGSGEKPELVEEVASSEPIEDSASETDEEPEETPESDTDPETFEIPVGDGTEKVTLEELKKGYMRERDYQFKRGEDAKKAKANDAKFDELSRALDQFETDLRKEAEWFDSSEAKELRDLDDPDYWKRYADIQEKANRYQKANEVRSKELEERRQKRIEEGRGKLRDAIPDWLDPAVQQKDINNIVSTMLDVGYAQEDIDSVEDYRTFLMARRLMIAESELDRLKSIKSQDISGKKVNKPPKSASPGAASTKESVKTKTTRDLRSNLKKTGNFNDALRLLREG